MIRISAAILLASGAGADEMFTVGAGEYVPFGKPSSRISTPSLDLCELACKENAGCKAFGFGSARQRCYLYDRVYHRGQTSKLARQMGLYGSGLAMKPKKGFVCGFRTSSFPPAPDMRNSSDP